MYNNTISNSCVSDGSSIIASYLPSSSSIHKREDEVIVDFSGSKLSFICSPPWNLLTIPKEGKWYTVSINEFYLTYMSDGIFPYFVKSFEGHRFKLGFSCSFATRIVHYRGFRRLLRDQEMITTDSLSQLIRDLISGVLVECQQRMQLPATPNYNDYVVAKSSIESTIETSLFPKLYDFGLCMRPKSLSIISFSKPFLELL